MQLTTPTVAQVFYIAFHSLKKIELTSALIIDITMAAIRRSTRLKASASHSVQIVSYNVLSSHLSEASYFVHCRPEDCDADTRYNRVVKKARKYTFPIPSTTYLYTNPEGKRCCYSGSNPCVTLLSGRQPGKWNRAERTRCVQRNCLFCSCCRK